jgi:GTP-binding protein HflX
MSAHTGDGIDLFLQTLSDRLRSVSKVIELLIPYERGDILAAVHREGEVVSTTHETDGVRVRARLAEASVGRLSEFVVSGGIDPTPTGNI